MKTQPLAWAREGRDWRVGGGGKGKVCAKGVLVRWNGKAFAALGSHLSHTLGGAGGGRGGGIEGSLRGLECWIFSAGKGDVSVWCHCAVAFVAFCNSPLRTYSPPSSSS